MEFSILIRARVELTLPGPLLGTGDQDFILSLIGLPIHLGKGGGRLKIGDLIRILEGPLTN